MTTPRSLDRRRPGAPLGRRGRGARPGALAALLAALACGGGVAAAPDPPVTSEGPIRLRPAGGDEGRAPAPGDRLFSVQRVVRRFDFEESAELPMAMPINFLRVIAPDEGYPRFGSMGPSDDHAASGVWSFRFDVDSASMAAEIPSSIIPVLSGADYELSVRVRTEGLEHAGAKLTAWLYDRHGNEIPGSRVSTGPVRSEGAWTTIVVRLSGHEVVAADLGVRLSVVQPRPLLSYVPEPAAGDASTDGPTNDAPPDDAPPDASTDTGTGGDARDEATDADPGAPDAARPRPRPADLLGRDRTPLDVLGRAWFDDLEIRHAPRVDLALGDGTPVVPHGSPAALHVSVHDPAGLGLHSRLVVTDLDGAEVVSIDRRIAGTHEEHTVTLPDLSPGWYAAALHVREGDEETARGSMTFLVLPPRRRTADVPAEAFALEVDAPLATLDETTIELVRASAAAAVVLPVWTRDTQAWLVVERWPAIKAILGRLLAWHLDPIVSLEEVPRDLADELGTDSAAVLPLLAREPSTWRPVLDLLLLHFGLEVRRWRLGTEASALATADAAPAMMDRAATSLARFVPNPALAVPWSVEHDPLPGIGATAHGLRVPAGIPPAGASAMVEAWLAAAGRRSTDDPTPVILTLDRLTDRWATPRQRLTDLALRALHLWRDGSGQLALVSPWTRDPARPAAVRPEPALVAWRVLADRLDDRRFEGSLELGPGIEAWILSGRRSADHALVVWNGDERADPGAPPIELMLSDGPVVVTDLLGRETTIRPVGGHHALRPDPMPVFVEGIDGELARLRASFAIEPDVVRAERRVHEHDLVLTNPWTVPLSGTIRIEVPEGWSITPSVLTVGAAPGETVRIPLEIVLERNEPMGARRLRAIASLRASRAYAIRLECPIAVAHPDLDMMVHWRIVPRADGGPGDVEIVQYVTNRGEEAFQLRSTIAVPSIVQRRVLLGSIEPGATTLRRQVIEDGAAILAGKTVRVTVSDLDGAARLTRLLEIPSLGRSAGAGDGG